MIRFIGAFIIGVCVGELWKLYSERPDFLKRYTNDSTAVL